MRARNVLLALLIIAVGMTITASRRGVFIGWSRAARGAAETVAAFADSSPVHGGWREVERFSRRLPAAEAVSLTIENTHGDISVIGQEQADVGIEIVRSGRGDTPAEAARRARLAHLEISRAGGALMVKVTGPRSFANGARLDFRVTAPPRLDVAVNATVGAVTVSGMTQAVETSGLDGDIEVTGARQADIKTVSGHVALRNIRGAVEARSASGALTVENVGADARLSTISGDIIAHDVKGDVSANTISGAIRLDGYSGSHAALASTSGAILASLVKPLTSRFSATTVSGPTRVALPPGSDCRVDLSSGSGSMGSELTLRNAVQQRGRLTGTLGGGRGLLELHSVAGSISLMEQPPRQSGAPEPARTADLAARWAGHSGPTAFAAEALYDRAVEAAAEANGVGSWRHAEQAFLAVQRMENHPYHLRTRLYLGRMYTRWGRYQEALDILPTSGQPPGGWAALSRAFCFDALGNRSQAIALYRQVLKAPETDTITRWAELGLQTPTWPKDSVVLAEPGERPLAPEATWRTSAAADGPHRTTGMAIDNNPYTRWAISGGLHAQTPGIWFELDLGAPRLVSRIVSDHLGVGNYDIGGWARGLEAQVTSDGRTWQNVKCSPGGRAEPATVRLKPARRVRAIRLVLTAEHDPEPWSIYELHLFGPGQ